MYQVTHTIDNSINIYRQKAVNGRLLTLSIEKDVNYISRCARDIMLGNDYPSNMHKIDRKISAIKENFMQLKQTYDPDDMDYTKHIQLFDQTEEKTMAFILGVQDKMLKLKDISADKRVESYQNYKMDLTPLAVSSRTYFSKIRQFKKEKFETISNELNKDIFYEKQFIILANVIISIIGIITMIFIYFIIKKQVKIQKEFAHINNLLSQYVIYSKTNLKGIITEVSDAFCEISQYSREELIGKPHNLVRHPNSNSALFKELWQTIQSGAVWEGEVENLAKNGTSYWVHANISPDYDEFGKHVGYIGIRYDITVSKNFEKQNIQLMQSEKMASLGEMIGNIAHQWRQPLSAISSIASSIKVQDELGILDQKDLQPNMESIIDKTTYLSDTINTFRDFIKGEKNYKDLIFQDEIKQALNIVSSAVIDNKIELNDTIDYQHQIHITTVSGELPQVIINIINNAKDALLEKKIPNPWVKLELLEESERVRLTIEDNAGGIPENIIGKIFEPYFTTKHQSLGTGLGLHMSYKIITESLKGKLNVRNTQNGAKFCIELPKVLERKES
jgi:PAS domain S-box-containing protein